MVICLVESTHSRSNQPEERRRVFGIIEQVTETKSEDGKIVGGVYARVYVPQEPLVVMQYPLSNRCIRRKSITIEIRS